MPQEDLEKFRRMVLEDLSLQARLRKFAGREEFAAGVVEAGAACGFEFTAEDVKDAMRANRRDWIERWI